MASPNVVDATDATFQDEVLNSDLPVLVDFWATWCAPCKAIAPALEALADDTVGKLKVVKLDAQRNMKTARAHGVSNLPTFLVFKGGSVVGKKIGVAGGRAGLDKLVASYLD
jgi:thioredoxin 1